MTKNAEFQKELKEKIKPGVKASDIKKLKRSKSADDIPASPSPNKEITQLKEQVKFHAETAANYLKSLQVSQAKVSELEEKLKQLKEPTNLTELDNSLLKRHQNLKDWFTQFKKSQKLDKELEENIDEASTELINQDKVITNLRKENTSLQKTNQSLQKDLNLSQRLAELRKDYPNNSPNLDYLKYALYSLAAVGFTLWLTNNLKKYDRRN